MGVIFDESGERTGVLEGLAGRVFGSVLVTGDRALVVSYDYPDSFDFRVQAFDSDGAPLRGRLFVSTDKDDYVSSAELDPTGGRLLLTTMGGTIRLLDSDSLEDDVPGWRGIRAGTDAAFSPDGRRIATCDENGRIDIWDEGGALVDSFAAGSFNASLAWSPDGRQLVVSAPSATPRVWDFEPYEGVPAHSGLGKPDIAVSPAGDLVAVGSDRKDLVQLYDARGALQRGHAVDLGTPHVAFAGEGSVVVGSELRRTLFAWDLAVDSEPDPVRAVDVPFPLGDCPPAVLADGRWLALNAAYTGVPYAWREGEAGAPLTSRGCLHLATSRDGERLLFSGWDGLWLGGLDGETLWKPPDQDVIRARFVSLSQDGRHVLAAGLDDHAYLWDLESPDQPGAVIAGHQAPLDCAVFSLDGSRIATCADDGSIRIWERESLQTVLNLRHDGVRRIGFTASGQLVSAGVDGTVRWWWLDPAPLRRAVSRLSVPELNGTEQRRVAHLLTGD